MIKIAGIQFTDEEVEIVKTAAEGGQLDAFKQSIKDALSQAQSWAGDHKAELIGAGAGGALGAGIGAGLGPKDHRLLAALLGGAGGAGLGYGAGAMAGGMLGERAAWKGVEENNKHLQEMAAPGQAEAREYALRKILEQALGPAVAAPNYSQVAAPSVGPLRSPNPGPLADLNTIAAD